MNHGISREEAAKILNEDICLHSFGLRYIPNTEYLSHTYEQNSCYDKILEHKQLTDTEKQALCAQFITNFQEDCLKKLK